ncbi:MAG: hypothetical protein A3K19_10910 [Lentisphaerae bacterium RIFOXYB12_FULL_65_16]|nr:MAG: hypothetical protein A3K18_18115 [Lentisphaerae bacterium RIFOXYA12_64_32]OGV87852.1 MAG: hypothetical protein A3K19_10910 [Lentisphaerae bacterium RIFOXYB12_FULL_65_16]
MSRVLKRSTPLYRQICSHLEGRILSGALRPGDRLPTTQQMAARYKVTVQTAQQAAMLLSRRGLIERAPGRGSFVSGRIHSRTVGIVFGSNVFGSMRYLFYQRLYVCLCKELKRLGWSAGLYLPTDEEAPALFLADLGQDVDAGRLRGLIPLCSSDALNGWLAEHPAIPHMRPGSNVSDEAGRFDAVCRGVDYLLGRGYRRIAVLMHAETRGTGVVAQATARIAATYAEHGLPMQATFQAGDADSHAAGVAQARQALARPDGPPDAFLVLNDQGCMGVIFELLCRRFRIPQDIGVMALANRGIQIPCPVPLTRFEVDPAAFARREIKALMAMIEGRKPGDVAVTPRLIVGKSCGE